MCFAGGNPIPNNCNGPHHTIFAPQVYSFISRHAGKYMFYIIIINREYSYMTGFW